MEQEKFSQELAVLFCSFDKNYKRWNIVHHFFQKYWPTCPFKVYLGANGDDKKEYCPDSWVYINLGPDHSWQKSLSEYVAEIPQKYVLLLVDDTALIDHVDNKIIYEIFTFLKINQGVMCRLNPRPGPDKMLNKLIGRISVVDRVPYVASWTNVIWDKYFLTELLKLNHNAWEFEIKAGKSELALLNADSFYACKKAVISYIHFVEKNKFDPKIKKLLADDDVYMDLSSEIFLSKNELRCLQRSYYFGKMQNIIPAVYRNRVRNFLGLQEL